MLFVACVARRWDRHEFDTLEHLNYGIVHTCSMLIIASQPAANPEGRKKATGARA